MESKRQKQVAELVRRNFGIVLQQEGSYTFGAEPLVTVTHVEVTPDLSLAKIYLSVYNTENKQAVLLAMEEDLSRFKQSLAHRIRRHIRRIPDIAVYLDETIDEMYRVDDLFNRLHKENQMGTEEEGEAEQ